MNHGWLRSKYTTTGEQYKSGLLIEQLLAGTMEQWDDLNESITASLCDINHVLQPVDLHRP